MKGKKAVEHAIEFLRGRGFRTSEAKNEKANGHDIVAIKNGQGYTFEVKPAIFKSRSYRVSKICKTTSDGILIVFPSGHVMVDDMKRHLDSCSKDGVRHLTFIGRFYE